MPCRVFARLVQASVGQRGPPLRAGKAREKKSACGNCNAVVSRGLGEDVWGAVRNGWNRPRQFVVARLRAPDPIGFPKRRPIGGVRGSLMSGRQKKSYWVGREASRELARNQCVVAARWRKRFLPPDMPPDTYPRVAFRGAVRRWNCRNCAGRG